MMASGWGGKQKKRRWTSLSMDETPGLFRRLDEDESRRAEWPAATLPGSAVNGKSRDSPGKAVSASLPRPKREGKPSLFTALTWTRGRKPRSKLSHTEGTEDVGADHQHAAMMVAEASDGQPGHDPHGGAADNLVYSERGVDVPDDMDMDKKSVSGSSSSSSSSSSGGSGGEESSHTCKQTGTADRSMSDAPPSKEEPRKKSEKQPLSASIQTPTAATDSSRKKKANRHEGTQPSEPTRETKPSEQTKKNPSSAAELVGTSAEREDTPGNSPETPDRPTREGEASRGETNFDTGRRFRLEATVMVDDERPAERRVTYLGPVLLSPLDRREGQYVHVTVAPGSGVQAEEGSSLVVRPARPVLVHHNTATPAKGVAAAGDEGQTEVNRQRQGQEEGAPVAPLSPASAAPDPANADCSTTSGADSVTTDRREAVDDVMDMTHNSNVTLTSQFAGQPAVTTSEEPVGTFDKAPTSLGAAQGYGGFTSDTLPLELGKESLVVMRERSEVENGPAPSPIPIDHSVFGNTSTSQSPVDEFGKTVFPTAENDNKETTPEPTPRPVYRQHKRSKSTSSSASSLSSSSTSSSDSRSKQMSYHFGEQDEKEGESEIPKLSDTITREEVAPEPQYEGTILPENSEDLEIEVSADDQPERRDSCRRPRPELLDPRVLLAGEGGQHKPVSREASPAAENRCDLKAPFMAGLHRPEAAGATLCQSSTVLIPDGDARKAQDWEAALAPYVLSVSEQTDSDSPQDVANNSACGRASDDGAQSGGESGEAKEECVLRQPVSRPQKPARTSLVKEDMIVASAAPLDTAVPPDTAVSQDTAVDRPLLPLKRTPRTSSSSSSSSSSSDSEDHSSKEQNAPTCDTETRGLTGELPSPISNSASAVSPQQLERSTTWMDGGDCVEPEQSLDEKVSSSESERYITPQYLSETNDAVKDSSSANSSQYITDTSLAEQVDLPEPREVEIVITSTPLTEAELNVNNLNGTTSPAVDNEQLDISATSSSSSQKGSSDSEKSSGSSKNGTKDSRRPPVFVTPPPPPIKPVRSCGSQSDLSDKSDAERDFSRTPPKPARSMDRLSPGVSEVDKRKSQSNSSTSSAGEEEHKPPVVPPRREKPKVDPASSHDRPPSGDPSPHTSFTSSEDDSKLPSLSKPRNVDQPSPSVPSSTEVKISETKIPTMSVQMLGKESDHLKASTFVPYEDSDIYYKDVTLPQKDPEHPDLDSSQTSSSSDQSKKGKSPKGIGRKSDKSSSSSDEIKKAKELDPPPVPPRQKVGRKKVTPDLNTSTSSSASQGSRGSNDRPSQTTSSHGKLPDLPRATADVSTERVLEGSAVVPKLPGLSRSQLTAQGGFELPDTPTASVDLQPGVFLKTREEHGGRDDLKVPLQEEIIVKDVQRPSLSVNLGTPVTDVKLPLKPRTPSPKLAPSRTPSPKVSTPRTPSPKLFTPRTPSPKVSTPRTPSPKINTPRTPSPKVSTPKSPSSKVTTPRTPSPQDVPEFTKPAFRPLSAPGSYDVKINTSLHTDEDTSEADVSSPVCRSVSMSSTTSATSQEGEKDKKGSRSRLRKYWPFKRRNKNAKKDARRKEMDMDGEISVSSPHLASPLPLHQSTPTLDRHASDPNTSGTSDSKGKHGDSDTSTLSESANEQSKDKKKDKHPQDKKEQLSTSTSSSVKSGHKKTKEKGKNKRSVSDQKKNASPSGKRSNDSSKTATPTSERKSETKGKTYHEDGTKHASDKSHGKNKEHDTSTSSSSSSSKNITDTKHKGTPRNSACP